MVPVVQPSRSHMRKDVTCGYEGSLPSGPETTGGDPEELVEQV